MNQFDFHHPQAYFFRFMFCCTPQAEAMCTKAVLAANLPSCMGLPDGFEEFSNYPDGWEGDSPGTKVSFVERETIWVRNEIDPETKNRLYPGLSLRFKGNGVGVVRHWWVDVTGKAKPVFESPFDGPEIIQVSDWPKLKAMLPSRFCGFVASELDPSYIAELRNTAADPKRFLWPVYTKVKYGTEQEVKAGHEELRSWLEEEATNEHQE